MRDQAVKTAKSSVVLDAHGTSFNIHTFDPRSESTGNLLKVSFANKNRGLVLRPEGVTF